jgi:2-polyprenyl-6-methoxyphenol hydroxylase-like FAD-dependent oxidoreductase
MRSDHNERYNVNRLGPETRAVVVGGSIAGLLAATACAPEFDEVVILDRDDLDTIGPRRATPQARQIHVLHYGGARALEELLPGVVEDLVIAGGTALDPGKDLTWFQSGGYMMRSRWPFRLMSISRTRLEATVRARVSQIENVTSISGVTIERARYDGERFTAVEGRDRDGNELCLEADLIVDATGRRPASIRWLNAAGLHVPKHLEVYTPLRYASTTYAREAGDPVGAILATPTPPFSVGTYAFPIDDDRWIVTVNGDLGGWRESSRGGSLHRQSGASGGANEPEQAIHAGLHNAGTIDLDAFERLVGLGTTPDVARFIAGREPLEKISTHRLPPSRWYQWHKLARPPRGVIALGDAMVAFNPVYGQGMSAAAMQGLALRSSLEKGGSVERRYARRAARVIAPIWRLAVGGDFRFPATTGDKPFGVNLLNRYLSRLSRAMNHDPKLAMAFGRVVSLVAHPISLLRPSLVARTIRFGSWHRVADARARTLRDERMARVAKVGAAPPPSHPWAATGAPTFRA